MRFLRLPFFISAWAYSFPLAALTLATLVMHARLPHPIESWRSSRGSRGKSLWAVCWPACCWSGWAARAAPEAPEPAWATRTATGEPRILLYFFWTRSCPHCRQARPFVEALPAEYPWLELRSHDISRDMAAGLLYTRLAEALGQPASSVPALLFCGTMQVGFDRPETTGQALRRQLEDCYRQQVRASANASSVAEPVAPVAPAAEPPLNLPLVGAVDPGTFSLPALTLVLAAQVEKRYRSSRRRSESTGVS